MGERATTAERAASRPRSSRITGWMPRTRSRISLRAALASSWASATRGLAPLGVVVEALPGGAEVHGQGDQALLGAVVEVPLDAAALGLGRADGGRASRLRAWATWATSASPGAGPQAGCGRGARSTRPTSTVDPGGDGHQAEQPRPGRASRARSTWVTSKRPEVGGVVGQALEVGREEQEGQEPPQLATTRVKASTPAGSRSRQYATPFHLGFEVSTALSFVHGDPG